LHGRSFRFHRRPL